MTSRSLLAACAAVAVTATTCSSGDDTASDTSTSAATTTTTTEAPTTTPPPTTTAETTTTTTEPPTTEQPTTTTTEPVDEVQEVIDSFELAWRAFDDAKLDPTDDAKFEVARARFTGAALQALDERIGSFRREGLRGQTNPDVPARADVYRDTVVVDGDTATLLVCDVNSNLLVETGAAPDGSDAVVNDDIVARLVETSMIRSGEGWLLARGVTVAEYVGQDRCEDP